MIVRLRMVAIVLLIAIDQLLACLVFGIGHALRLCPLPSPDETISSHVGRGAIAGKRWAAVAEWLVDGAFSLLSRGKIKGHCRASIEWDEVGA